jgi:hypothetical protein
MAPALREAGYVGAVCSVRFSPDESLLYAGVGPYLRVYRVAGGELLEARRVVPDGSRVHGICFRQKSGGRAGWDVAAYGQKCVAIVVYTAGAVGGAAELHECGPTIPQLSDWVLDACFVPGEASTARLLVGLAHNCAELWCYPQHQEVRLRLSAAGELVVRPHLPVGATVR